MSLRFLKFIRFLFWDIFVPSDIFRHMRHFLTMRTSWS